MRDPYKAIRKRKRKAAANAAKPRCGAVLTDASGTYICEREAGHPMAFGSKHRQGGVSWTDAGAEREKAEREKAEREKAEREKAEREKAEREKPKVKP
jgi:hypothetical protein